MKMMIKFLGTSSGEKIPREGCDCFQCRSKDKKDKRKRSAILVNRKILVDAGPDIKKQLQASQINNLEAVLITHEHQDHTSGIRDLLKIRRDLRIIRLKPGIHFKLIGVEFYAFRVKHSNIIPTVGVVIDNLVYLLDLSNAIKYLNEAKIAILDGSVFSRTFGGHMAMIEQIGITKDIRNLRKIYFTHNGHTHKTFKEMTKLIHEVGDSRYSLAYDGLEIKI
jgi:ribonuclease BN (tRNA processing enzyme)